jgi:hypothetical protein
MTCYVRPARSYTVRAWEVVNASNDEVEAMYTSELEAKADCANRNYDVTDAVEPGSQPTVVS